MGWFTCAFLAFWVVERLVRGDLEWAAAWAFGLVIVLSGLSIESGWVDRGVATLHAFVRRTRKRTSVSMPGPLLKSGESWDDLKEEPQPGWLAEIGYEAESRWR